MEDKQANVQDATVGVVAYITLIGFIVAIVLNSSKAGEEKKFGAFHLRQALGMIIMAVGLAIVIAILSALLLTVSLSMVMIVSMLSMLLWIGFLVLLVLGIVNAANKTYKPIPVVGDLFNKMLGQAFE